MVFRQLSIDQMVVMEKGYWKDFKIIVVFCFGGIFLQEVG